MVRKTGQSRRAMLFHAELKAVTFVALPALRAPIYRLTVIALPIRRIRIETQCKRHKADGDKNEQVSGRLPPMGGLRNMTANGAALVVEDLHKSFGDLEVLKGISLSASSGDVISILGSSGSGKSTFLRCINLLETPNSGRVSVGGETIEMKPDKDGNPLIGNVKQVERLRTKLGMVFQNFCLWSHLTVLENIIEAPIHVLGKSKAEAMENAEAIMNKVGIWERRSYYPAHLSGGQQQRAAIARALAMDPEVLLFDEPTSALDPELVGEVLKVMRDLAEEGRTMLVVTHEMGFARDVSNRVIFLHEGLVEEDGEPQQVFQNPKSDRFRQFLTRAMD